MSVRWRVPLSFVLVLGLALAPARAATLQSEYLDIYLKLNDSERLEHTGDFRGALEGFEDCYAKLRHIHMTDPDWEPVLVTSRIEDCRAKIAELEPKVLASPGLGAPTPEANPEPGTTEPGTTVPRTGELATMQARLQEVEQELAATKQALEDTQQKYQASQQEVQTLHAQLDGVNQQLAALKSSQSVDQSMGDLMARNKELTDKLASAQTEIKALTSSPKSAAGKLAAQLKMVQEKLDASEAANAGLTETTTTLQQQLNQAQQDLAVANNQLATTGPGSPQYLALKHENDVMRGILLREIQEQSRRDGAKRLAQEEFDRLKITSRVLQEQLDILGSPMTPPNNDEERQLLASIKVAPSEVTPMVDSGDSGNHFSATTSGAPISETNAASAAPSPTNEVGTPTVPLETNATPSVATDTNAAPAASTNSVSTTDTNTAPAASNAPPSVSSDTNAAPAATNAMPSVATDTNAAPATPDTNAPSAAATTNAAPTPPSSDNNAPGTASAPSSTNAAPAVTSDTNAAPATNAPSVATDTNAAPAPATNAAPVAADTNAAPAVPTTNTTSNSTTASTDDSSSQHQADLTRYANKPRLPDDMREVAQEATDLFENKHYDEAAAKYQTIIDKYPESLYAWSNLGVVRSQQGKLQEAMKALQQAVKLSPNDAFSYRNLGIVYYQLGQNDAAIDALERSIALDPNNVYSHDYLGCACSQKGWEEVAEKEFRKAIEINDDFPDAHYNLAIVYAMQKPPALALARREYKRSLDLGLPHDPRLEKLLGL
jgi:Flp pilus assembly protein TadD/cob(I)alamin adenosyltransferase